MCSYGGHQGIFNVTQVPFHGKRQTKESVCPKQEDMGGNK